MNADEGAPEPYSSSSEEEVPDSEKMEDNIFPAPEAIARAEGTTTPANQLGLFGGGERS